MAQVSEAEFNQLTLIGDAGDASVALGLRAGDILMHHRHHGDTSWPTGIRHPHHCSIVDTEDGETHLYDSMPGDGLRKKDFGELHDDCVVFRPKGNEVAESSAAEAGTQAALLYSCHQVGYGDKDYFQGCGRALGCLLARKKFSAGTRARLNKYIDRGYPKNAICSELVILCYQMPLSKGNTHFINIDGKYTTPHGLESYLLHHPSNWELAGKLLGKLKDQG
jgi:hypothetical protein